jgi:exopolyphosphatase/guanosine-5'-triphosphate,3'-diphosphate pyrophosphatase
LRRACIDIGSNTTRLLVADCEQDGLIACRQERAFTHLGRSLGAARAIPISKLQEVVVTVSTQFAIAREMGAEQIRCVATAGVRHAVNGGELVAMVSAACDGLEVEVLDGADEARLAFVGAAWGAGATQGVEFGVIDAGGGSSELVVGRPPDRVDWWVSLPIGSGEITARWLPSTPTTATELERARESVRSAFSGAAPPQVARVVAVGGGATSMRLLAGHVVDASTLDYLFGVVQRFDAVEIASRFGIDAQRARLLPGGLVILEAAMSLFGAPLEISRGGMREGLLLSAS